MNRIVLITRRFWPLVGGAVRNTANLAESLAVRGAEVTVLTAQWEPHWPRETSCGDVRVTRVSPPPNGRWSTTSYLRSIARWLRDRRDRIDLVHVSGLRQEAYTTLRAIRGSVPVVLRAELAGPDGDCQWQSHVACGRHIRRQCQAAGAVIAPNRTIERELLSAGYPGSRIRPLTTGVPIPAEWTSVGRANARAALAAANPALAMPADVPLAVYVGRLERTRGLSELVLAWRTVLARQPDARLWLIGEGPSLKTLQDYVEDRRLVGRVILGGLFDNADEVLAAADVFVLPAPTGGVSLAMLEAMAAGLPIVTLDTADHRDLVTDGEQGMLLRAPTAERLAAAVIRLFDDPDLAARLGAAARLRAINRFSLERMGDDHLRLFASLSRSGEPAE